MLNLKVSGFLMAVSVLALSTSVSYADPGHTDIKTLKLNNVYGTDDRTDSASTAEDLAFAIKRMSTTDMWFEYDGCGHTWTVGGYSGPSRCKMKVHFKVIPGQTEYDLRYPELFENSKSTWRGVLRCQTLADAIIALKTKEIKFEAYCPPTKDDKLKLELIVKATLMNAK